MTDALVLGALGGYIVGAGVVVFAWWLFWGRKWD